MHGTNGYCMYDLFVKMKERGLRSLLVTLKSGNMQLIKVLGLFRFHGLGWVMHKDPCNRP